MKSIYEKLAQLARAGELNEVGWFALNCAKSVAHLSKDPPCCRVFKNNRAVFISEGEPRRYK